MQPENNLKINNRITPNWRIAKPTVQVICHTVYSHVTAREQLWTSNFISRHFRRIIFFSATAKKLVRHLLQQSHHCCRPWLPKLPEPCQTKAKIHSLVIVENALIQSAESISGHWEMFWQCLCEFPDWTKGLHIGHALRRQCHLQIGHITKLARTLFCMIKRQHERRGQYPSKVCTGTGERQESGNIIY